MNTQAMSEVKFLRLLRGAVAALLSITSCAVLAAPPVKNKPPSVTLESPVSGASFVAPASIQLSATASDPDGTIARVDFYQGKKLIGSATAEPYQFTWAPVAVGSYSITAKATDNAGANATSPAAVITVTSGPVNQPPTVSLTAPAGGASYGAPATIALAASAADADGTIAKVEFFRGGNTLIGTVNAAPYNFSWGGVPLGTYSITAKATDNTGATATSAPATVAVVDASTLTTITSPTAATNFTWPITDVSGTFSGSADTTVLVSNGHGNTVLATLTGATTYLAKDVPLLPGPTTLTATAVRRDGTASSAQVTVDMPQRLVVLTSPTKGAVYEMPPSLTFEASTLLSNGTVQRVDYIRTFVGKIGSATAPPYTFVWNNPPKGSYSVYALMVDDKNIGRQSQELSFTIVGPNVPPTVALTAPSNNSVYSAPASFTLQASASDSDGSVSQVEFLQNGQLLGGTNVAPYTLTVSNLLSGAHAFAARATDDKGAATTSSPVSVTVATAPQVSLASSAVQGKAAAGSSVTLTATPSSPSGSITRVDFFANAVLIGSATSTPFSLMWPNVSLGEYVLTARATDSLGLATTSDPLPLSVVAGPSVSLTEPTAGAKFVTPTSITVSANASTATGTITSVAFHHDGNLIGTDATAPFSVVWQNAPPGSHVLTAVATDDQGVASTSPIVTITVAAPSVMLDSPQAGASVPANGVQVRGRVTAQRNSGVTVNGQIAMVDSAGNFYANDVVPMSVDNSIQVVLSTPDEALITTMVVVTPIIPAPTATDLTIAETESVGPIKAVWSLTNGNGIRDVTIDTRGDGTVILRLSDDPDYVAGGTTMTLTVPYSGHGLFKPIVTVEDMLGNVLQKQFVLQARSVAEMDALLKDVWARMLGKIKVGDFTGALTATTGGMRPQFRAIFESLQPSPAEAVDQIGTLSGSLFGVESAEYVIIRQKSGEAAGYPIQFIRSADGVWRVDAM